jgi:hypothetical protein
MHALDKWKPRIDATRSEAELLEVVHAYCDAWLPSELLLLPDTCQLVKPASGEHLANLAVDFKRADLGFSGPSEVAVLLRQISQTFTHAAERLRVFHHPAARGG